MAIAPNMSYDGLNRLLDFLNLYGLQYMACLEKIHGYGLVDC
jgi:hypothetical protein